MPTRLTPKELQEIASAVGGMMSTTVIRDLDFPETEKISEADYVAIVQNGVNKKVGVKVLYDTFHIGKYTVNLYATRGSMIIKGSATATIIAEVLKDQEDITDRIPDYYFSWERSSLSGTGDDEWNMNHRAAGKSIVVGSADVNGACTFYCDIPVDSLNNLNI